jgi:hypothetical protein
VPKKPSKDKPMPLTTAALATELNTDPTGQVYAPLIASGNDAGLVAKLNALTAINVFRNDIASTEIVGAIAAADWTALTTVQCLKLSLLINPATRLDATNANTRAQFLAIFAGMTTTIANLTTLAQRPGSRAEVLFGTGVTVGISDVSFALRGVR